MIDIAARIRTAVDTDMNQSDRSKQSAARLIGPSEIGGCRAYLAHMIANTPYDDGYDDIKWAAYVGTYLGAAIENGLARWDDTRTQVPLTATYPSGLQVSGHCDLVFLGEGVGDVKSKDGLQLVRRTPPSLQYLIQVNTYLLAAIQAGLVPEDATWNLIYVDRSGECDEPYVVSGQLDMDIILIAESRLDDALYAAEHNLNDAPRDMPMDWCLKVCLTGDTEVVTRQGIRPIRDLAAEGTAELLVPSRQEKGLTWHGSFSQEKVLSFGVQPVRTITLRRGRQRKVVRATPEHQWILRESGTHQRTQAVVRTEDLRPGDTLRSIRRNQGSAGRIPVAQMHGYVYGDGHRIGTRASTQVQLYTNGGDNIESILPLFAGHDTRPHPTGVTVVGLPSLWKQAPDMAESPLYLLSWLSGYFAADGHVSKLGQAVLYSASRASLDLARSVCAIAGVGYGPITTKTRLGKGKEPSELHSFTLRVEDLPEWFFLRPSQRTRAAQRDGVRRDSVRDWKVVSVEDHGEVEEVFCAVVDGVEAFALSDGLLTHNCPFLSSCRGKDEHQVQGLITSDEHLSAVKAYREGLALEKEGKAVKEQAKAVLTGISGSTGEFEISWTWVDETTMPATTRAGYNRMTVRKVPTRKVKS